MTIQHSDDFKPLIKTWHFVVLGLSFFVAEKLSAWFPTWYTRPSDTFFVCAGAFLFALACLDVLREELRKIATINQKILERLAQLSQTDGQ